ncbi:MAG TPA: hypothetical protein VFT72_11710 [Opitutaceae bacterium]|nr:hypothetical protein [Opitutaceae bacterium]
MYKTMLMLTLPVAVTLITGTTTKPPSSGEVIPPQPVAAEVRSINVLSDNGSVDRAAYASVAKAWGAVTLDLRLGPTFAALNPDASDDRPTNFKPESKECKLSFANRTNPYELGKDGCVTDTDYWSDSGQVAYAPDDPANDPGLDRIQVFAYYNHVYALSPRLDYASGKPHPDPQTREKYYKSMLGHYPQHPVAMVRNYGMLQNEALVVYREGLIGVAGTQTSRAGNERPYPGIMLPANKVPTAIAVTAENEFAVVTVWDTDTLKGQLAVIAIEAKYIPFHTWPYMSLPNQGSFSDLKLLGYVDLPMSAPTSVAAASNGWWGGPSQTNNKVLSQIDLKDAGVRKSLAGTEVNWGGIIALNGYAIVASKSENKIAFVDLSPLFQYVRDSYLSSEESFQNTVATRGSGPGKWPLTFAEKPEITPTVVSEMKVQAPTAVLAGLKIDRWSPDVFKAYAASEDGTLHIFNASSLMARWSWQKKGSLTEMGTMQVGRNPTNMIFTRFSSGSLPDLLPAKSSPDPLNNLIWVTSRGDRRIDGVVTYNGKGAIYRTIKDARMGDPVAASVATRGNILTVADYNGKKIMSFRIGSITDRFGVKYGAGEDGTAPFEFAGEMPVNGHPFAVNSANVN